MNADMQAKLADYKLRRAELDAISQEQQGISQRLEDVAQEKHVAVTVAEQDINTELKKIDKSIEVAHNANIIITDLEKQFKEATRLDPADYGFLFFAIALQCARMFFQPKIDTDFELTPHDQRHDSNTDGKIEREQRKEELDNFDGEKSNKYVSIEKMFLYPVPYDAMEGTQRIVIPGVSAYGKQLYPQNHHSATMGHDPVLGYIFGTANIMTRTITFKNPGLQTCEVHLKRTTYLDPKGHSGQYVTKDVSKKSMFDMLCGTLREDYKRLPAGVTRHTMHLQSDKYCTMGLPIPFISAEEAQQLLKEDWNSYELERLLKLIAEDLKIAGIQAILSALINAIIEQLHKLTYKPDCGISRDLYSVKTHRIIEISNTISSSSNLIYTALTNDLSNLDIGGLCVTLYRLWKDEEVIKKIKQEFIYGSFYDMLEGN